MNTNKLIKSKLFEDAKIINFDKYVGDSQIDEQVKFELRECEKALTMLRNRLLYAKNNTTRVEEAFEKFSQDANASYERIFRLRNTFNSSERETL